MKALLLTLVCWAACGIGVADTITNLDRRAVAEAIEAGGSVWLAFDGTVGLGRTLMIATNTTVDASGQEVTLDIGHSGRHFVVTNGATLRLINLTLANGRYAAPAGETHQPGSPGWGGSIYNAGGKLELFACHFLSNQVQGGKGGPGGQESLRRQGVGRSDWFARRRGLGGELHVYRQHLRGRS